MIKMSGMFCFKIPRVLVILIFVLRSTVSGFLKMFCRVRLRSHVRFVNRNLDKVRFQSSVFWYTARQVRRVMLRVTTSDCAYTRANAFIFAVKVAHEAVCMPILSYNGPICNGQISVCHFVVVTIVVYAIVCLCLSLFFLEISNYPRVTG